ncbi:MAG: transglutaminase-like cysteine peptidase [Thiomicrorhabdus sp.]|jgi:predicted transglutaminase-like cysteine proteinase|nr:transglutaminase-like cysteine peptidase [Thiomicrorhabdus sp.]
MKKIYIIITLLILFLLAGCVYGTDKPWAEINKINREVNESIAYWDNPVDWQMPVDGKGDCTTYAIVKQIELKKIEVDSQLYSCSTTDYKGHAVLIIDDYVLDNEHKSIWHKDKLDYINYYKKE